MKQDLTEIYHSLKIDATFQLQYAILLFSLSRAYKNILNSYVSGYVFLS